VKTSDKYWQQPLKWNEQARKTGRRLKVFCGSACDIGEDNPEVEMWREELFELIFITPYLDWLLLTKRIGNILDLMDIMCFPTSGCPMFSVGDNLWPNVWIGTSVENQKMADLRIPQLLDIPAYTRFLSVEPLIGEVDLVASIFKPNVWNKIHPYHDYLLAATLENSGIHWVIVGGESGSKARKIHPDWVRQIRDQCQQGSIPFFFKQWGTWLPIYNSGITPNQFDLIKGDKKQNGSLLDDEWHREFPESQMIGLPQILEMQAE
jgi:protein gp37